MNDEGVGVRLQNLGLCLGGQPSHLRVHDGVELLPCGLIREHDLPECSAVE